MIVKLLRVLLVLPVLGIGWALATESGLWAVVSLAQSLTGQRLQLSGASGSLVGVIGFDTVSYDHPAATVTLKDVRLDLRLSRLLIARVQAESLSASELAVVTHARRPPPEHVPLTVLMPLRIAVEQGELKRFDLQLDDGARRWGVSDVRFAARWRDQWIVVGKISALTREAGPVTVRGRLAMVDDLMQLEDIRIDGSGSALVRGALALADSASNDLELSWQPLRWSALEGLESAAGQARLEGPWSNYGWNVKAQVAGNGMEGQLTARGRGSLRHLAIHRAQLSTLGGELRGSGDINWQEALRTTAKLEFENLDPGLRFKGWDGALAGEARLSGVWQGQVPQLAFDARLRESRLRGYPLALAARGNTRDGRLVLEEMEVTSGASRARVQGRLLPDFDLTGDLDSPDLQSLWAGLTGKATLHATLSGTLEAPRLKANGAATDFEYRPGGGRGYRAAQVALAASLARTGSSEFQLDLAELDVGLPVKHATVQGQGTLSSHRVHVTTEGEAGSAGVSVAGGYAAPRWQGRIEDFRLAPAQETPWVQDGDSALQLAPDRWSLGRLCLASQQTRVCAEGQSASGGQSLSVELRELELRNLKYWLPAEWTLSGAVSGTASARLRGATLEDLRADLKATPGKLEGAGVGLGFGAGSLRIEPDGERLHARLRLAPAGGEIDGEAWLAAGTSLLDRPLSGQFRAHLPDLAWLPVLSTEVSSASGSLDAQLALAGTPRSPALEGRVSVGDARVVLATPGIELTGIKAVFESGQKLPLGVSIQAQSGGGTLQLDGGIEALRPEIKGRFTLTGDRAQWINTADIRAWVSPKLELTLSGPDSTLSGEILVPRAGITPRDLSSGGVAPTGDQILIESGRTSAGRGIRLQSNVQIVLGEEVRFNGLGLKTRLEGSILATDQPGRPTRAAGELRTIGGRYRAYGQDLTIETGRLLFNGGVLSEPGIELSAYRELDSCGSEGVKVRVGLRARGSLQAPAFALYAEPLTDSLRTQEQQLSCLVLGRPLSETLQSGQRTELDSAAASLGFAGGEYLANRLLAPRLGIDEFSVDRRLVTTAPGQTSEQARLMLGKYLSPKLFVSYGFGLFQPGRFFRLQYDLGRGFKLSGESGEVQSGDLVYTIER